MPVADIAPPVSLSPYFLRVNPDLLALVPPDAKTVLEIGCADGSLFEAYRRMNPTIEWHGVELNPEAAAIAKDRGVHVRVGDVEQDPIGWWTDGVPEVDVLIFADVLEHLRDPWKVLETRKMWVKPAGLVLACVPNVAHYSLILRLLEGGWRYEDEGLLDRTHLRFFDVDSLKELFAGAGLDIFEIRGRQVCFDPAAWLRFEAMVPSAKGGLDDKMIQLRPDLSVDRASREGETRGDADRWQLGRRPLEPRTHPNPR